jgi:nucleoside-diphosphate-sugar epimerase
MNIFVTGDSGFIGSYLTRALLRDGHMLFGVDIDPRKKYDVRYPFVTGNILDEQTLAAVPESSDCIIHLAAAHKDFGISKEEYYRVNVDGTRSLLRFAEKRNIKKFIFFSTVAVYGDHQPSTELTEPHPVNHYGGSKLAAEKVLQEWAEKDISRSVTIIRPTVVFGPLNVANIFKLIKQVCDGKFYWVGDGRNVKSVAYVENVADATCFLVQRMEPGVSLYNYSDEPHMKTRDLVALISRLSGKKVSGFHLPLSAALAATKIIDIVGSVARIDFPITSARLLKFNTSTEHRSDKIRQSGFVPTHSIEEGLQKNIQWYFENSKTAAISVETSSE